MGWTASDLPDLSGRRAVVTGANSGIGYFTALELARHGADVTMACRDQGKGDTARRAILAAAPTAAVQLRALDLSSLESVRAFVSDWSGPLDLLVNNAGVMAPLRRAQTVDGFELQMGTNHLGHFALTGLLLDSLLAASAPRVVTVSSLAHLRARLDLDDLQSIVGYSPQRSYANSKLANLLFAVELQRRAESLTSVAAHPGLSSTGLVTNPDGMGGNGALRLLAPIFYRLVSQSAAAGALPTLYGVTEADPGSYTGPQQLHESRGGPGPAKMSKSARDPALAGDLFDLSAELTGVDFAALAL
jgi:NAD(P)-dependent dehydrogenase (short-subunit alcohol dehydrogenase family)